MAFNDERVVRRLAASTVVTVSAVGHEIDTSLTDLVADARAATPSQAAEMVVAELTHNDFAEARANTNFPLRKRRPELYDDLIRPVTND